ncbi:MAG: leucyl aminopeptidase, partial [Candidatus Uhrbacteria bacterium]|nr:leucyl aminopeptidase [Candidatus Uhrbacteria bacterium]
VNTPSMEMTPKKLAEVAQSLAKRGSGISIKILDAAKMEKLGMRAALAVGKGSQHAPVGMHLIYRPKGKIKKKIAVIGKAVTFDSGGLSLKPADGMMTMKCDMAGAAAVIGLFQALPDLAPNVEVHGIFLAVENMPSGTAYRPGDVVKAMNGTMIEVLNTDAEGRVTLADALSYAATLKPDVMIDLATLTGACVVALGEDISGLMSNDRKLAERLLLAAKQSGEGLWELPLFEPYQELIKSKVGDIKNIGGRSAGAITAGLFLSHFVNKIPWAHLDIAGPAYIEKETRPDVPYGGSGSGVRLLARYLQGF